MTDIQLLNKVSLSGTFMDWIQSAEGLSEEQELATAVRVALGTDRLASPDEQRPDLDSVDRRGWWGDMDAEERTFLLGASWTATSWPIGCKSWLLLRAKISDEISYEGATIIRAKTYTREALQPFLQKRICSSIDVDAVRVGKQEIDVHVVMWRGPRVAIELRYQYLWNDVTGL